MESIMLVLGTSLVLALIIINVFLLRHIIVWNTKIKNKSKELLEQNEQLVWAIVKHDRIINGEYTIVVVDLNMKKHEIGRGDYKLAWTFFGACIERVQEGRLTDAMIYCNGELMDTVAIQDMFKSFKKD